MSLNIYCSIPFSVKNRDGILKEVREKLTEFRDSRKLGGASLKMSYYGESERHDNRKVRECDVMLVMHQENDFDFNYSTLASTAQSDVNDAKTFEKKVFLLYRTRDGNLNIYSANLMQNSLIGIPGTTYRLFDYILDNIPDKSVVPEDTKKVVAQIGKQSSNIVIGSVPDNVPELVDKTISVIDLTKRDRRLLI